MLLLYLALMLTIGQAQFPGLRKFLGLEDDSDSLSKFENIIPGTTGKKEADASYLKADMLKNIGGIFYSGGGFISHGEGAAFTWGLNKYFNRGKGLADLFSDMSVSTNSGGGWFFNDVMYSKKFVKLIEEPSKEKYLSLIADYYYGIISEVYDEPIDTIMHKTDKGRWTKLSPTDYDVMFLTKHRYHSWEELVTKFHYMYGTEPILPLTNCKWTSLFGLGQDYNNYEIFTGIETIDDPQKSTWSKAIPGFIDFTFESGLKNPTFEVQFPILDNWHNSVCSIRKTSKECDPDNANSCMKNAYCDKIWKLCVCQQGFVAFDGEDHENFCGLCLGGSESKYFSSDGIKSVDVEWSKALKKDPVAQVDVATIKQMIHDSINDPKKYSGPSSCAIGESVGDSDAFQTFLKGFGLEGSWQTAPLTKEFNDKDAPRLSLLDGGGEDNCGLTGLVRRIQSSIPIEKIESSNVITVTGICTMAEVAKLISNMNGDQNGKNYEIFEFRDKNEPAQLQWGDENDKADVTQVWGFKVRTVREPVNGILYGTEFNIFAFSFPYGTSQHGVCRNQGFGGKDRTTPNDLNCPSNNDKDPEDYYPLMSLLPGRGEVPEVQIASKFMLDDMTSLAEHLGVIAPTEPQTSSIFLDLYEVVTSSTVSDAALKILATIGVCFVLYSLVKKARKTDEFTPISSGEFTTI